MTGNSSLDTNVFERSLDVVELHVHVHPSIFVRYANPVLDRPRSGWTRHQFLTARRGGVFHNIVRLLRAVRILSLYIFERPTTLNSELKRLLRRMAFSHFKPVLPSSQIVQPDRITKHCRDVGLNFMDEPICAKI